MKLFLSYLKLHVKSLVLFTAFSSIFAVVFYLYSLPFEAVVYSTVLCAATGAAVMIVSFFRFREKHRGLQELEKTITVSLDGLPEPKNIMEEDYISIINALFEEKRRAQSEKSAAVSDMTDYFTLWVHQIKTPIAATRLILQSGAAYAELDEQLFKIEQYVEMVMTFLRSDMSTRDYVFNHSRLDGIIKGAVRKYAKLFIRKKLPLDYGETDLVVLTDEKWLSFVIEQILSNSIKYTSEGKISIYALGKSLVIEDTGIGIAPEDLPRVCEKGYTGYNGRADKKSTGIGLYLCKRILDGLSHSFRIESEPGKGTRVIIGFDTVNTTFE